MNQSLVFQIVQFVVLMLAAVPLAIFALRAASKKSLRSTMLYRWNDEEEQPRWERVETAAQTGLFGWTWGQGFGPRWSRLNDEGKYVPVVAIGSGQLMLTYDHTEERWLGKDSKYFLLVKPRFAVPAMVKIAYALIVVALIAFVIWQAGPKMFISVPTVVAATSRPASTPVVLIIPTRTIAEATRQAQTTPTASRTPVPLVTLGPCLDCTPISASPTPQNTAVLLRIMTPVPTKAPTAPSTNNSPIGGLILILFGVVIGTIGASIYWLHKMQ